MSHSRLAQRSLSECVLRQQIPIRPWRPLRSSTGWESAMLHLPVAGLRAVLGFILNHNRYSLSHQIRQHPSSAFSALMSFGIRSSMLLVEWLMQAIAHRIRSIFRNYPQECISWILQRRMAAAFASLVSNDSFVLES